MSAFVQGVARVLRIRATFTRSSVRAEHPSFSDWATGVLLAAAAELERRENGGRPFPGGEAGEIGAGRPLGR